MSQHEPIGPNKSTQFPQTSWSDLGRLSDADEDEKSQALNKIVDRYWAPIYVYLRRIGLSDGEAQDTVQDFLVFSLESGLLTKAEPSRGRFRSFLLASLRNHLSHRRRWDSAGKRMPAGGFVSLEEHIPVAPEESPEEEFHRVWLRQVILQTAKALETKYRTAGRVSHFELFEQWVLRPELGSAENVSLSDLAERHGLSMKEASNQIVTAKRAFQKLLIEEISSYATSTEDQRREVSEALSYVRFET